MPAVPKSPITQFGDGLKQASALFGAASVFVGAAFISLTSAPGRIVIIPTAGTFLPASNKTRSLCDLNQFFSARVWGKDIDHAWDLMVRLLQAINEFGDASARLAASAPGPWWDVSKINWDVDPDTTKDGQEHEVVFSLRFTVDALPTDQGRTGNWTQGRVDQTSIAPEV